MFRVRCLVAPRRKGPSDRGGTDKTWIGLCRKTKAHPIFNGAKRAKGDLDPLLLVPADVRVDQINESLNGRALLVSRIGQFVLQLTEEALPGRVIGITGLAGHGAGER